MEKYISIEEAKYVEEYKIYMRFNDGRENILDFRSFILKAQHPDIKKYKNIELFKNFELTADNKNALLIKKPVSL